MSRISGQDAGPKGRPTRRVIFVNRFFFPDQSATSQLLTDLAAEAAKQFDVTVICSNIHYDRPDHGLPLRERVAGADVRRIPTTRFGRERALGRAVDLLTFYVGAWITLLAIGRPGDVVVAKTDPPLLSILAQSARGLRGTTVVNWLQDVYPEVAIRLGTPGLGGSMGRLLTAWRDSSLRSARTNVALGGRMADHVRRTGTPAERIRIVPNWCDEEAIRPTAPAENPLRRAWGLEGKFVVAYAGNLGRAHEFETMLRAALALKDAPDIVFIMIGGGAGARELERAAGKADLSNILFKPYQAQSDLNHALGVGDVHWISLRPELEGLIVPSKVYGVLAAGRPIIALTEKEGEIAALVRQHGCGYQVDPGDGEAFAGAVRALAADSRLAARLGAAARAAAEGPLSRSRALESWLNILADASNQTARRPLP